MPLTAIWGNFRDHRTFRNLRDAENGITRPYLGRGIISRDRYPYQT